MSDNVDGELDALLSTFYEAAGAQASWSPVVQTVMASLRAGVGMVVSHDYETGRGRIEHAENLSDKIIQAYCNRYSSVNIWLRQEGFFRQADTVVTGEKIVPLDAMPKSEFYQDWLRPAGIHYCAWGVLARKEKRLVCAGFGRPDGDKAFTSGDLLLIARILPHFRRIMQLRALVGASTFSQHILMEMLGALSVGVALLDEDCQIVEANAMAAGWLARESDIRLHSDPPDAAPNGHNGQGGFKSNLQTLLKSAYESLGTRRMSVMRSDDPEPVTLILAPLQVGGELFDQFRSGAVLIISDPEYRCRIREDQLMRFYDFTPTEAKLARLISNGRRLDQASKHMGISYQTARTHLKRVFSKTGIDRQSELVRLLLTGPASFRLPANAAERWFDMHCDELGSVHRTERS